MLTMVSKVPNAKSPKAMRSMLNAHVLVPVNQLLFRARLARDLKARSLIHLRVAQGMARESLDKA